MIYFDNNATTPIAPEVFEAMKPFLTSSYGNPSSAHALGRDVKKIVENSRAKVASLLGAPLADEIIFTSCGTESDNWAISGALRANPEKKHIVTTRVEHEAVRNLCEKLERESYEVTWLEVDENGFLDLDELKNSVRADTAIVSVMLANNETGILFPVAEIAEIVKENSNAIVHSDGVNAVGKIPVDLKNTAIDLFSLSGHKFYAPKGVGALYVRDGITLPAFFTGGGQENGRRAGTEAVHQIAALGKAAELAEDFLSSGGRALLSEPQAVARGLNSTEEILALRNKLEDGILKTIPNATLNGIFNRDFRLPNTSSISFANTNGEAILAKLNDLGVCVSTGSACNSENHTASAVLQAMNIPYSKAMGAIRFSLGRYNTEEEVDFVLEKLPGIIQEILQLSS
jgi:cysteine desulfurase